MTKPRPGSEAAAHQKEGFAFFLCSLVITVIIAALCFTSVFGNFFNYYHVHAIAKDTKGIPWNHIASYFSFLSFFLGPLVVWLGWKDELSAGNGSNWLQAPWALYLLSIILGIGLSAGFDFILW